MRDVVRRVGQRFAIGFEGHTVSPDARALLEAAARLCAEGGVRQPVGAIS